MNSDNAMQRLRAAKPVRLAAQDAEGLFTVITATPADLRLALTPSPSLVGRRRKRLLFALAAAVLLVGVGTGWAASGNPLALFDDPQHLFQSNPQYDPTTPGDALWNQHVIPASITQAAVVTIPGLGSVQFWYAETGEGGWCSALRLPDGRWSESSVPGCQPSRAQVNANGEPVYVIDGFDYNVATIVQDGLVWDIYYGIVAGKSTPARVVDSRSGLSTPVTNGKTFALAEQDASAPPPAPPYIPRLVAYDAEGHVIAEEPPQAG